MSGRAEKWKPLFCGDYSVSNLGRVRRDTAGRGAKQGKILKCNLHKSGYYTVSIHGRTRMVHQLVAWAFIGPYPSGKEPNHKNGIKTDNSPDNLEYVTHKKNMEHASVTGLIASGSRSGARTHPEKIRRGETNGRAILSARDVRAIRRSKTYKDAVKMAPNLGISIKTAEQIWYGKTWEHLL